MPDFADPLIQGMMAGLQFRRYLDNAKMQREQLDMRKQAFEEARTQRARQNELQDLQTRLALAMNPALEEVSGGVRKTSVAVPKELQSPVGLGPAFSIDVPVENPIGYQGRDYAVRGPEELLNRRIAQDTALAKAKYNATAVPFDIGGQSISLPPTAIPGAMSNKARIDFYEWQKNKPERVTPQRPFFAQTPEGSFLVAPTGEVKEARTPSGQPIKKSTAGGEGSLSRERFEFSKSEAARKAREAEEAKLEANLQKLQADEDKHHVERTQVGELAASGDLDKKENNAAVAKFKAATQAVQDIQHRKAKLMKAAIPPKAAQDAVKEGESRTAPDGHVWYKKDGILYIVK